MAFGLRAAAEAHQRAFEQMLAEIGEPVVVQQPPTRPTTSAGSDLTKVLGTRVTPTTVPGPQTSLQAIVSGPAAVTPQEPGAPAAGALGLLLTSDLVLRVRLADVLLDPTRPHGRTLFDTAATIQLQGTGFKVKGTSRGGLAPLGPYILWIGLESLGT